MEKSKSAKDVYDQVNESLGRDLTKIIFITYLLMIFAWPQTHDNIFYLPFKFIFEQLTVAPFGTPWGLLNGEFYQIEHKLYFHSEHLLCP